MANEGYVSLDLVITADIEKQFEKICSDAEKPAKKLGESIGSFISETIENSSVSIPDIQFPTPEIPEFKEKIKAPTLDIPKADMSEAEKIPDELDRIIAEANKRYYEPLFDAQLITGPVEAPESESKNKKEFTNYDPIKIQAEIDEDIRTCLHKLQRTSFRQILPIAALKKLIIRQYAFTFSPCTRQNYARKSAHRSCEDRFLVKNSEILTMR